MIETDILYAYVKKEDWLKKTAQNIISQHVEAKTLTPRQGNIQGSSILNPEVVVTNSAAKTTTIKNPLSHAVHNNKNVKPQTKSLIIHRKNAGGSGLIH